MNRRIDALILVVALIAALGIGCERGADGPTDGENAEETVEKSPDSQERPNGGGADRADSEPSIPGGADPRTFEFVYEVTLQPGDGSDVDLFVPLATDSSHQTILDRTIESPVDGEVRREETYGNEFWHASLDELPEEATTMRFVYEVRREVFRRSDLEERAGGAYETRVEDEHDLFLQANKRVPLEGDLIEKVIEDSGVEDETSPLAKARSIYEFVIDKMEYKKVGEGWGNGDTYWACSEEYGNCTDYHALYTSMARNQGIPARFEIGFPIPTDRESGDIGGYHCWLQFYLPEVGWTPIDVSEADKHPELKEMYFGTHPANRIRFTVGRDLQLGDGHDTGPLNYFIYPLVEVGEERYDGVETAFSYRDIEG